MNTPAFQFYPGDWLKDPCLAQCSLATKGAWIDLLAHMHEAKTPGKLEGSYQCFSRMCRCSVEEIEVAILELKATKTATVTISKSTSSQGSDAKVTVVNRRMLKAFKTKQDAARRQANFRAKRKSNAQSNEASNGKIPYSSVSSSSSTSKRESREPIQRKSHPPTYSLSEDIKAKIEKILVTDDWEMTEQWIALGALVRPDLTRDQTLFSSARFKYRHLGHFVSLGDWLGWIKIEDVSKQPVIKVNGKVNGTAQKPKLDPIEAERLRKHYEQTGEVLGVFW